MTDKYYRQEMKKSFKTLGDIIENKDKDIRKLMKLLQTGIELSKQSSAIINAQYEEIERLKSYIKEKEKCHLP